MKSPAEPPKDFATRFFVVSVASRTVTTFQGLALIKRRVDFTVTLPAPRGRIGKENVIVSAFVVSRLDNISYNAVP